MRLWGGGSRSGTVCEWVYVGGCKGEYGFVVVVGWVGVGGSVSEGECGCVGARGGERARARRTPNVSLSAASVR